MYSELERGFIRHSLQQASHRRTNLATRVGSSETIPVDASRSPPAVTYWAVLFVRGPEHVSVPTGPNVYRLDYAPSSQLKHIAQNALLTSGMLHVLPNSELGASITITC